MSAPDLIFFLSPLGGTEAEQLVARSQRAAIWDLVLRAQETEAFRKIIIAAAKPISVPPGVILDEDRGPSTSSEPALSPPKGHRPFHFGRRLKEIIHAHGVEKALYLGCLPLLSAPDLARIAGQLSQASSLVATNNIYSSDLVAFAPARALEKVEPPLTDNPLAWLLHKQGGLPYLTLPPSASTLFDVDTPTDLKVLKLHRQAGPHVKACLESLPLDLGPLERVLSLFSSLDAQIMVAGRVGSLVWSHLERDTQCHVRLLSEERGMQAEGRGKKREIRSLLGFYLEAVGARRFFQSLGEMAQAILLDSRVLFQHRRSLASQADRFYSDLGQPDKIEDPFVREFTRAALEAPFPVVLGGHSLVSGGLLALLETYQQRRG